MFHKIVLICAPIFRLKLLNKLVLTAAPLLQSGSERGEKHRVWGKL
jgi:hypothetical protein